MPSWKRIVVSGSDATLNTLTVSNGITGSLQGTASYATQALSASFAPSTPTFPFTGSAIISGSLTITGSLNNNGRINVGGVYTYSPTSSGITIVAPNESADYKGNLEIMSSTSGANNGGSILLGGMQTGPIMYVLAIAKVVAVDALPVKAPTNVVDVTDVKPAIVVLLAPNDVEVVPIVIAELTKFALATVADAMSVPVIVPSTIIADVTLPDPIAATPPVPIVISPDTPA